MIEQKYNPELISLNEYYSELVELFRLIDKWPN